MRLGAALIVRNVAEHLERCLTSIHDLVDEVVVVDTGSVDATVEVARRYGARVDVVPWEDDFSTPRNRSLDLLDADWVLYIDADEAVEGDVAGLRRLLAAADDHIAFRVRFVPRVGWTGYREYRLWRHRPDIRFHGRIHESMLGPLQDAAARDGLRIGTTELITLQHYGYEGDQSHKYDRDEPILLAQIALTPERVYLYDHLARVREGRGDADGAVAAWTAGIERVRARSWNHPDDPLLYIDYAIHRIVADDRSDALAAVVAEARARFAMYPTLEFAAATLAFARGDAATAATVIEPVCLMTRDELESTGGSYDARVVGEWSWNLLGLARFDLGDHAGAAAAFARAEALAPQDPAYTVRRRLAAARGPRRVTRREAVRAIATALAPGAGGGLCVPDGDWETVLDVAAGHGLLPALWPAVRDAAATARGVARAPYAIVEDADRVNRARIADLEAQGHDVLDGFAAEGIAAIPLKGWHGLLVGRWPDPAARVMVDLDVLVAADELARAAAVLADLGYVDLGVVDPEGLAGHEVPARGRPGRAGSIELQREVLVPRRAALLPAAAVRAAAVAIPDGTVPGARVPSPTHAMVLCIAHAEVQDDGARLLRVPLRALVEATVMATGAEGPRVDWDEVEHRFHRVGAGVPLAGFAVACADLTGVDLPVPKRGGAAWWTAAAATLDHPRGAVAWREFAALPRTLSSERMARRYGASGWVDRQRARIGHVVRGLGKRVPRG